MTFRPSILGKTIKRAASKLSLSSREKSNSTLSVKSNNSQQSNLEKNVQRARSTTSIGVGMDIGEAVRTRFIWDHGGNVVYVCVMQNGIKKSYRLLKENEGYHSANATLWAGRCEFRYASIDTCHLRSRNNFMKKSYEVKSFLIILIFS